MEIEPMVSAITIFLNGERFIQEAIESILAQSYEHWELWLVDDGSTDGSTAIARQYADRYPTKIYYLEHPGHHNQGMSASRNLALRQIRGEYVAFLDADDVWLPQKLEQQLAVAAAQPQAGMIYGPTYYWHSWTGQSADFGRDYLKSAGVPLETLYQPPELLVRLLRDPGVMPGNCSLLVRTDVVKRINGFENHFTGMYEDQVFFAKICVTSPIYVTSAWVARYRQHPDSSCAVAERQGIYHPERANRSHRAFLDWLDSYLRTEQVANAQLWQALRRQQRPYRWPALYSVAWAATVAQRRVKQGVRGAARRLLPPSLYGWLLSRMRGRKYVPPVGGVRFGSFRRLAPINRNFGYDRGQPVDRYYIENFLRREAQVIAGRVLEIGDATYTHRFGGAHVTTSDVLHVTGGSPQATLVGDLADAPHLPTAAFDCVILTQTLQLIYDIRAALDTVYRILKPGGVVLATMPGISHIGDRTWRDTWYWNATQHSVRRLFVEVFGAEGVTVEAHGNVLVAIAFLQGLAVQELDPTELDFADPDYPVLITVRATKEWMRILCAELGASSGSFGDGCHPYGRGRRS